MATLLCSKMFCFKRNFASSLSNASLELYSIAPSSITFIPLVEQRKYKKKNLQRSTKRAAASTKTEVEQVVKNFSCWSGKINYKFNVNESLIYDFTWPRRCWLALDVDASCCCWLVCHVECVRVQSVEGPQEKVKKEKKIFCEKRKQ